MRVKSGENAVTIQILDIAERSHSGLAGTQTVQGEHAMNRIFLKSAAVAFASVAASLLLTLIVIPAMGFPINRTIWLTSTVCPLALAWLAGAYTFWQGERLKSAHRDL